MLKISFYFYLGFKKLNNLIFTFVFSRWVLFSLKCCINIFTMRDKIFLVCIPSDSKTFTIIFMTSLFIKLLHRISIWCRFLFGVS